MEQERNKKGIITFLVIVIILLIVLCFLFATKTINSKESEVNAKSSEDAAKSYAVGNTGTRAGEDTDNARYYQERSEEALVASEQIKRDVSQMKSDVYNIKLQ